MKNNHQSFWRILSLLVDRLNLQNPAVVLVITETIIDKIFYVRSVFLRNIAKNSMKKMNVEIWDKENISFATIN